MQIKKFEVKSCDTPFCTKEFGTFLITFNVNELLVKGAHIDCDYEAMGKGTYRLSMAMFIDEVSVNYEPIEFVSSYTDLKDNLENYIRKNNFAEAKQKIKEVKKKIEEYKKQAEEILGKKFDTSKFNGSYTVEQFYNCLARYKGETLTDEVIKSILEVLDEENNYIERGVIIKSSMIIAPDKFDCFKEDDDDECAIDLIPEVIF